MSTLIDLTLNKWKDIPFKENLFTTTSVDATLEYIFARYGKGIYIKIIDNSLIDFTAFKNNNYDPFWTSFITTGFKNPLLDNFIVKNYDNDSDISWIQSMFETLCANRELPDCEFFINSERNCPLVTKDRSTADYYATVKHLVDNEMPLEQFPILSFSTSNHFKDLPIPTIWDWYRLTENIFGIEDFRYMKWEDKMDKYLYRGNCLAPGLFYDKEPINQRLKLVKDLELNEKADVGIIDYIPEEEFVFFGVSSIISIDSALIKTSNEPLAKYKYIFVLDGEGAPKELSTLLFTGSCIIKIESTDEWENWFSTSLEEGKHYLSVDKDFKNLKTVMEWCEANDDKCKQIGLNAREFATKFLDKNGVLDYLQNTLNNIAQKGHKTNPDILQYEFQKLAISNHTQKIDVKNDKPIKMSTEMDYEYQDRYSYETNKTLTMLFSTFNIETEKKAVNMFETIKDSNIKLYSKSYSNFLTAMNAAFIGFQCINQLRREIPNFCQTVFFTTYSVMTEYVSGLPLDIFLDKFKSKKEEVYIQIFMALQLAYERFCFTHNNLKPKHIIVQILKEPITIKYMLAGKTWAIRSKYIPIITNFSNSIVLTELENVRHNKRFNRMFVGDFNKNYIDVEKPGKDVKYLLSQTESTVLDANETPFQSLKNVVTTSDIKSKQIKFGVTEDDDLKLPKITPRLLFDKILGVFNPHNKAYTRVLVNPLPQEETGIGNVILKYEITQSLKSVIGDMKVSMSVDLITSENLYKLVDYLQKHYNDVINSTASKEFDDDGDLWGLRMYIRKYMSVLKKNNAWSILRKVLSKVLSSDIRQSILLGLENTIRFYRTEE